MRFSFVLLFILLLQYVYSQEPVASKVRVWRQQEEGAIVREFVSFLSIPNVASDSVNIQKNAAFILQMMKERGIHNLQLLMGGAASGYPPAVYGEVLVPGAKETIGFYAHYDGQPVNPAQWARGLRMTRLGWMLF